MKVVVFKGGLGNQIFEYMYYQFLSKKYPNESIYGCYPQKGLAHHNGLEIHKIFDVELPKENIPFKHIFRSLNRLNNLLQRIDYTLPFVNFEKEHYHALFHDGYWQDKRFLSNEMKISFREPSLNHQNSEYLSIIRNNNSVAIHVRRGDYLNKNGIHSVCSKEYYNTAIALIKQKISSPYFLFFSDDPEWVHNNFNEERMSIVTGNSGKNSYIDMYLMSQCNANIIANSTFSFWGAYLTREKKIVIYPKAWFNSESQVPKIALENWINI